MSFILGDLSLVMYKYRLQIYSHSIVAGGLELIS